MVEPFAPLAAPPRLRAPFIWTNAGSSGRLRPKMPVRLTRAASWRSYQAPASIRVVMVIVTNLRRRACGIHRRGRPPPPHALGSGPRLDMSAPCSHAFMLLARGAESHDHLDRCVFPRIFFTCEYTTVVLIPDNVSEPMEASQNAHPDARRHCTVRVRCGRVCGSAVLAGHSGGHKRATELIPSRNGPPVHRTRRLWGEWARSIRS